MYTDKPGERRKLSDLSEAILRVLKDGGIAGTDAWAREAVELASRNGLAKAKNEVGIDQKTWDELMTN